MSKATRIGHPCFKNHSDIQTLQTSKHKSQFLEAPLNNWSKDVNRSSLILAYAQTRIIIVYLGKLQAMAWTPRVARVFAHGGRRWPLLVRSEGGVAKPAIGN